MNIWIKRSLGTAAIAGGLFFAGATAANADDASSQASHDSHAAVSSPLEIGGIKAGVTSQNSSSSSSTTTRTDSDGNSSTNKDSSQESSKSSFGLESGAISVDPSAALSDKNSSKDDRSGSRHGADNRSSSSSTAGSAKSPVHIGGIRLHATQQESGKDSSKSSSTNEDGDSRSQEQSSEHASTTGGSVGTGDIDLSPQAALAQNSSDSSDSAGNGGSDESDDAHASHLKGSASSPVSIGGLNSEFTNTSASKDHAATTVTDRDGTQSSSHDTASSSSTNGGLDIGRLSADPAGSFSSDNDSSSVDNGGTYNADSSSSSSAATGSASAPVTFAGISGGVANSTDNASTDTSSVTDEDGTRSSSSSSQDANTSAFGFDGGGFALDPAVAASRASANDSNDFGDYYDLQSSSGSSTSALQGSSPFTFDGFGGSFAHAGNSASSQQHAVSDGDQTVTDSETTKSQTGQAFGARSGTFTGNPAFGYTTKDSNESLSANGGDDQTSGSTSASQGTYAFPYRYEGAVLGGDFADANGSSSTHRTSDQDGTVSQTDSNQDAQQTQPSYSFDGLSGNPAGTLSLDNLLASNDQGR